MQEYIIVKRDDILPMPNGNNLPITDGWEVVSVRRQLETSLVWDDATSTCRIKKIGSETGVYVSVGLSGMVGSGSNAFYPVTGSSFSVSAQVSSESEIPTKSAQLITRVPTVSGSYPLVASFEDSIASNYLRQDSVKKIYDVTFIGADIFIDIEIRGNRMNTTPQIGAAGWLVLQVGCERR